MLIFLLYINIICDENKIINKMMTKKAMANVANFTFMHFSITTIITGIMRMSNAIDDDQSPSNIMAFAALGGILGVISGVKGDLISEITNGTYIKVICNFIVDFKLVSLIGQFDLATHVGATIFFTGINLWIDDTLNPPEHDICIEQT